MILFLHYFEISVLCFKIAIVLLPGESASAGAPPGMVKPDPDATRGERLWAVARLSLERHDPARVLYRHEMARLHLIRG